MSEKNKILELKESSAVTTYLSFLQDNITRMAGNSGNVKALIAVIYTIFATVLITVEGAMAYWWMGFIITIGGMNMDAYYLAFERMYRKKYNNFVKKLNVGNLDEKEIYNMNPKNTDLKYENVSEMLECMKSFSIVGFYILFIAVTFIFKFI